MPCRVIHNEKLHVVEVINQGAITGQELREVTKQALAVARSHHTVRFLIDDTEMESTGTAFDLFYSVDSYEQLGVPRSGKAALILPVSPQGREHATFYETLMVNRGYNVRLFPDRQAATAWLLQ